MLHDSILGAIGGTPIVRLPWFSRRYGCELLVKLEHLNPGGSHKARIALGMVRDAEARGVLVPHVGQTILEPSGGNTGIGLAMVAAHRGYRLVLVIPDNYSEEKRRLLKALGARIVLSDSRRGNNSHGELAMSLQLEHPDWVLLNQQRNPANPETHRMTTAREILDDFGELRLDVLVAGIGTGGHITGVGQVLRQRWPALQIFGVEPEGCSLLENRHHPHRIQGLSIGLVPAVLDTGVLSGMARVGEAECIDCARSLMLREAIGVGLSSAANVAAVGRLVADGRIRPGARVLTFTYDAIESYLSAIDLTEPDDAAEREDIDAALA